MLMAVLSIGQMWAVDYDLVYTLDGSVTSTASGSSAYATAIDIVDNGITWNVMGNTTLNPWGIGGKNLSSTGRELFSKGAVTGNIAKIEIEHGAASSVTVNSMKVEVATDAAFSDIVSTCNPTFAANSTVTVNHPDGDDAWEDCYYRITYYLTIGGSNKKVEFKSAKFYKEKSASDPVLESITISGDLENKSYEEGQSIDFTGLTATGHYNNSSTADLTDNVEWSFSPALTAGLTSVTVTATLDEISGNKEISGLTVAEHVVTPGTYDIPTHNDLWGTSYSGQASGITTLSGSKNDVSITINKNSGSTMYVTGSQTRIYSGYTMVFSVPDGYAITALQFTADGSNWAGEHTADVGTMTDNKNWSGEAKTVTISVAGTCRMKAVKVTYAVAAPSKTETGLAYAEADQKKLTKLGEAFTAPTLANPNNLTVAYASNNTEVAEVAANGAVTIKAVGVATITASYDEDETYQAGSASYTIGVTTHAGTEADPYVAADAKIAIDAMGTVENAYASGIVSNVVTTTLPQEGYISFYFSADGNTTGQQIEAYKCYGLDSAPFEALTDVKTGATVVVTGTLKKFNSTYEFDQNCHLVSYEAPAVPKTHIANDQANPYTVAQALVYAADGVTYDLDDYVYVQGVVYDVKSFNNGAMNIFIKDANTENQFELYKCAGINDGNATTPFEALTDVRVGNIVIGYGQLTVFNNISEFKQGNYIVDLQKPITGVWISELAAEVEEGATFTLTANVLPANATGTIDWTVEIGDAYASVADGVVTGIAEGEAVIRATAHGTEFYKECTVTVTAKSAPDTRKVANSPAEFEAVSGDMTPADITFASYKGGAGTDPFITSGKAIRLYQISGSNAFGGYITLTAVAGCTIDEVQITTTSTYSTTVAYSKDGNENLLKSESVSASGSYTTGTGLNVSSVNILNMGTGSSGRLEIASIKVYYTGEAATIDHYELGGTYATEFEVGDDFNHNGLIVYAAYDALGENKVDITSACTFSTPDMSTEGQKTIDITYKEEVVKNYTITVNASTDTRKVAESPATFTAVSGDMVPADITFASYKGGAGNDPYLAATGIRLYQISGSNAFGGFITLTAKKGCTIDQVKITTSDSYATTIAYSVDGNENLLGSESVAKSSDYSTPSGLNVESVNILNLGTGSSGRLEIASIKVWYTGDALPVHHYILGGTYETVFEQFGTFSYEGLTVTAAYDELETITEAVTGFTVEADLSTAGAKKAEVMLNSVKIAEYDITVTESPKEDPALAYSPASVILTLGQSLSAPTFINTHNVSPISYNSDKPAVATVDAEGNISLAGGIGVAVITASFAGDDNYIESEATFTITVNEPAEDLSGTWVLATSVAVGDRIIIGATYQDATKTMGAQNTNNRAAVASTYENLVLTPTDGTKTFLVVDAGDGKFALQALNGKYLTASGTGTKNYLTETADYEADNAKWTISFEGNEANVVASSSNRNTMRYNSGDGLFSCYATGGQRAINIYKKGTPDYGSYNRDGLTGNYGTICLPNGGTIEGATLFDLEYFDGANTLYLLEVNGNAMVAGKPYIFLPAAGEITVTYTDNAGADAGSFRGLVGSYTQETVTADAGNYILYNNAYYLVNSTAYVGANRAYIHMEDVPTSPATYAGAPRRRVAMNVQNEQVATGVDALNATEAPVKMIINGQLFILRGEKMYNANGQLVK